MMAAGGQRFPAPRARGVLPQAPAPAPGTGPAASGGAWATGPLGAGEVGAWPLAVLAAVALALSGGCLFGEREQEPPPEVVLPPPGEGPPNGVELAVYVVSHPAGDAAREFARQAFLHADEGVTAPDVGALWRANGLRLGLVQSAVVERAEDMYRSGPTPEGGQCAVRRLRIPHRGSAVIAATQPLSRGTFLLTLPGRRAVVKSLAGASVVLRLTCRVVDERTAHVEVAPEVLTPGRETEDTGLLDFLTTEMAVEAPQAILVGTSEAMRHTAGIALLTSGEGERTIERVVIVAVEPVCIP